MLKRNIGMGIMYACCIWLYTEYTELKCKYTLKTAECEFYKKALQIQLDAAEKNNTCDKKEKDKK